MHMTVEQSRVASLNSRYTAIVASTTVLLATGLATPFSPDFYTFTALRFVMGMTFYSFCFLFHVLGEYEINDWSYLINLNFITITFSHGECQCEVAQPSHKWWICHRSYFWWSGGALDIKVPLDNKYYYLCLINPLFLGSFRTGNFSILFFLHKLPS